MEKVSFAVSENETVEFFVLEQTRIHGTDYLLVTDSEDDEATAYILKDVSASDDAQACYVIVEEEEECDAVARVFQEELGEDTLLA